MSPVFLEEDMKFNSKNGVSPGVRRASALGPLLPISMLLLGPLQLLDRVSRTWSIA